MEPGDLRATTADSSSADSNSSAGPEIADVNRS
jgi:hypothetical protein